MRLVEEAGLEIVILRRGKPVAKITPLGADERSRHPLRGRGIWISDDFDEPLDDLWESLHEDDRRLV
jgi:antitoxin (DNA-binding transcriptional repressor) of toxin-antitoxin stability system